MRGRVWKSAFTKRSPSRKYYPRPWNQHVFFLLVGAWPDGSNYKKLGCRLKCSSGQDMLTGETFGGDGETEVYEVNCSGGNSETKLQEHIISGNPIKVVLVCQKKKNHLLKLCNKVKMILMDLPLFIPTFGFISPRFPLVPLRSSTRMLPSPVPTSSWVRVPRSGFIARFDQLLAKTTEWIRACRLSRVDRFHGRRAEFPLLTFCGPSAMVDLHTRLTDPDPFLASAAATAERRIFILIIVEHILLLHYLVHVRSNFVVHTT